jgi:hypothetical protein
MHYRVCSLLAISAIVYFAGASIVYAVGGIGASGDTSQPSTTTMYNLDGPASSFQITENVFFSTTAGPWHKNLKNNTGQEIDSGHDVPIVETLTNIGSLAWTDWHEAVTSTTMIGTQNGQPGFLFDSSSLSLSANYGLGVVPLTQGVDYTVSPTLYSGPSESGNDGNWQAIDIFFSPAAVIAPGDQLIINKDIFEVFGNADVWEPNEAAVLAEFPTVPEPAALTISILCIAPLLARRRGRAA